MNLIFAGGDGNLARYSPISRAFRTSCSSLIVTLSGQLLADHAALAPNITGEDAVGDVCA